MPDQTFPNLPPALARRLGGATPRFVVRTGTRVDTGYWGYRPRLWAAVTDDALHLFAPGKAAYHQVIPSAGLTGSFYNHVTAAVVLAGDDDKPIHTLRLDPTRGRALLQSLRREPAHA